MANQSSNLDVNIRARDQVTPTIKTIQSSIIRFVGAITASLVAVRGVAFPVQQAAAFEKELKNVQKTTGFTEVQIASLGRSLNNMSTNLVASQVELAQIAATAGQLGLGQQGVQAIEDFTLSVARASVTFGIAAESLSTLSAQILNVFNIPVANIENVFSAINEVSNNSVASAEKLVDIIKRVGNVAGLSLTDVTALAAATQDLGVTSEVAGTTLVKQFSRMQSEASDFAKVMSITTEEWTRQVEDDALSAFKAVLTRISELDTAAQAEAIKDLFGGGRIFALASKQVTDAANNFEILDRSLRNANDAYADGQSSIREYAVVSSSLDARVDQLGNNFRKLAIEAGNKLIPVLKEVTTSINQFLKTPEASAFFDSLADSAIGIVENLKAVASTLAEWDIVWRNIVPILKVFLALSLAKYFTRFTASLLFSKDEIQAFRKEVAIAKTSWAAFGAEINKTNLGQKITKAATGLQGAAQNLRVKAATAGPDGAVNKAASAAYIAQAQKDAATVKAINAKLVAERIAQEEAVLAAKTKQLQADVKTAAFLKKNQTEQLLTIQRKQAYADKQAATEIRHLNNRLRLEQVSNAEYLVQLNAIQAKYNQLDASLEKRKTTYAALIANNEIRIKQNAQLLALIEAQALAQAKAATAAATAAVVAQQQIGRSRTGTNVQSAPGVKDTTFAVGSAAAKNYTKDITKATGALARLGQVAKSFGSLLLRFVLGPIGSIAITLGLVFLSFKDDILGFFGFVGNTAEDARQRAVAKEEKAARDSAKAAVEAYQETLNQADLAVDIEARLKSDDQDIKKLAEEEVANRVDTLTIRLEGLSAAGELVRKKLALWAVPLEAAKRRLSGVDQEIADTNKKLDFQYASGDTNLQSSASKSLQEDLNDQIAERKALLEEIANIEEAQGRENESALDYAKKRNEAVEEFARLRKLTTSDVTAETYNALVQLNILKQQKKELLEKRDAQKAANFLAEQASEAILSQPTGRGGKRDSSQAAKLAADYSELQGKATEADAAVRELEASVAASEAAYNETQQKVRGTGAAYLVAAEKMSAAATAQEVVRLQAKAINGELQSNSQKFAANQLAVEAAATEYVRLGTVLKDFRKNRVGIDALGKAMQGLKDNVTSTVNASQKAVRDLGASIKALADENASDIKLNASIETDPTLRRQEERTAQRLLDLENERAKALLRGDKLWASILDQRIKTVTRVAEIEKNGRKAEITAQAAQQQITDKTKERADLEARLTAAIDKRAVAVKTLTDLSKSGEAPDSFIFQSAQKDASDAQTALASVQEEVDAYSDSILELGRAFVTAASQQKLLDGVTEAGGTTTVLPIEDIQKVSDLVKKEVDQINQLNTSVIDQSAQGAEQINNVLDNIETRITKLQGIELKKIESIVGANAAKEVGELADKVSDLQSNLLDLAGSEALFDGLLEKLRNLDQLADVTAVATGTLQVVPVEIEPSVSPAAAEEVADDVVIAVNGRPVVFGVDEEGTQKNLLKKTYKLLFDPEAAGSGGANVRRGYATGGYIRGPGTGTSDSILARLSNREYVVKAKAVAHYGVDFMRRLNNMALPKFNTGGLVQAAPQNYGVGLFDQLNSVRRNQLPKFAAGGLVSAAASGIASASSDVNLNINMGGRRATLRGEKDQVRAFVDMLNNIEAVR